MKTIVLGHNSPDLDSIVSAMFEAKYLQNEGIDAAAYRGIGRMVKGTEEVLQYLNFKVIPKFKQELVNNPVVLVDYNDLALGPKNLTNITKIIDHHTKKDGALKCKNVQNEKVGATATLIAEKYLKKYQITKQEARLLLFAIVADSQNFTSSKTSKKDKKIAKILEEKAEFKSKKAYKIIKKYSLYKFNKKHLTDYVKEDVKLGELNNKTVASAVVVTLNYKPFLKHYKLIVNNFENMLKAHVRAIVIQDIKHKKSIILHNGSLNIACPIIISEVVGRRKLKQIILNNLK